MKLALSGRIFESQAGYTMDIESFLRFARECGYEGVEIRYPQLPLETPVERQKEVAALLKELGLTWVYGAVEGIVEEEDFERAVQMLELHRRCGCTFTRFTIFEPEDISCAQRFADEAVERGQRTIMQIHTGTLTDGVEAALDTLECIDRPNVGLAYEACHLRFEGVENYAEAIPPLAPHLYAVALQNYKPAGPSDPEETVIEIKGQPYVRAVPGDPDGIDFGKVFEALQDAGCTGFANVMADAIPGMDRGELARQYAETCRRFVGSDPAE